MKPALWIAVALALAAGCSVNHRSTDFACSAEQRCADGRTCVDGFCVIAADSGAVDTPGPLGDAAVCPSPCTSCNPAQKICTVDCSLNSDVCNRAVSCPAGWNCNVLCSINNQCNSGVSCGGAASCTITCSGRQTCRTVTCGTGACNVTCLGPASCNNQVTCGTGACNVNCSGNLACGGEVSCGQACACDVRCQLNASCAAVLCKPGCLGTTPPALCISTTNGCNSCR